MSDLDRVMNAAAKVYRPEGVTIWIDARNQMLDGRTPRECIDAGDTERVLDLLLALAEGVTS